jgi:hypothetical protein
MFAGSQLIALDSPRIVHQHQHFELSGTSQRAYANDCQQTDTDYLNRPRDHHRTSFIANSIGSGNTKAFTRSILRRNVITTLSF